MNGYERLFYIDLLSELELVQEVVYSVYLIENNIHLVCRQKNVWIGSGTDRSFSISSFACVLRFGIVHKH